MTQTSLDCVIPALMQTLQSVDTPANLRRRAGLILGRLGWLPEELDCFVEVPPGKFFYNENQQQREIRERYWIGKYPVTNHQYARFIQAGGYRQRAFWTQTDWDWLQKNNIQQPLYWDDLELSNPLCPVVGVSWRLYPLVRHYPQNQRNRLANRARRRSHPRGLCHIQLPTETAWERAARGSKAQEYPWPGAFDPHYANVADDDWKSLAGGTTAVCTYPQGVSPVGAWDLAGNVWEWCLNHYSQPEDCGLEGEANRELRGGSWVDHRRGARASYRLFYPPVDRSDNLSFRVVCLPPIIEH